MMPISIYRILWHVFIQCQLASTAYNWLNEIHWHWALRTVPTDSIFKLFEGNTPAICEIWKLFAPCIQSFAFFSPWQNSRSQSSTDPSCLSQEWKVGPTLYLALNRQGYTLNLTRRCYFIYRLSYTNTLVIGLHINSMCVYMVKTSSKRLPICCYNLWLYVHVMKGSLSKGHRSRVAQRLPWQIIVATFYHDYHAISHTVQIRKVLRMKGWLHTRESSPNTYQTWQMITAGKHPFSHGISWQRSPLHRTAHARGWCCSACAILYAAK